MELPIVPVVKNNGDIRILCGDFRTTMDFRYPLPRIEEIFGFLADLVFKVGLVPC